MRIAFSSDWQIGAGAAYGTEENPRLADQRKLLVALIARCVERGVDALVFGGDAFETRRPTADELVVFRTVLDAADAGGLYVAGMPGNHDISGPAAKTSLDVFGRETYLDLFTRPGVWGRHGREVAVGFLPWSHPGTLRANDAGATPIDAARYLTDAAAALRYQTRDYYARSVLVVHWALSRCELPTGIPTALLREPVLDVDDLLGQGWDLVVGAHIHKPQRPEVGAIVLGSPYVVDFGEAGYEHGFWVWDSEFPLEPEFVALRDRPFVTIDLDASDTAGDAFVLWEHSLEDAVVRVRVRGSESDLALTDFEALRDRLYADGASKVYALEAIPDRRDRARVEIAEADDLSPTEALDLWLGVTDLDGVDPEAVRKRHIEFEEAT